MVINMVVANFIKGAHSISLAIKIIIKKYKRVALIFTNLDLHKRALQGRYDEYLMSPRSD